jgi:hypothetical protein
MAGHYEVLGVQRDATAAEVRRAYLALARRHHPDREGGSADRMRALNEAWATLGDPEQRRVYDRSLSIPPPRAAAPWPTAPSAAPPAPAGDLADLFDDRPIHGGMVRLPGWIALTPPGLLALGAVVGVLGLVFRLGAVVAFGFALSGLGILLFVLSPFIALAASRRGNR